MTETDTGSPPTTEPEIKGSTAEIKSPIPEPSTEVALPPDISRGSLVSTSIDARIRYARELAAAGLLPSAFRQNPGNVLYAVEFGNMLGIHPLAAITGVHVMDGKPTASPALMSALVRRAGHKLRVRVTGTVENGDLAATATLVRHDDPGEPFVATWTIQRAQRGGLVDAYAADPETGRYVVRSRTSKGNPSTWEKFPEAMCKARAVGEVCREGAEEALCGVHYTPEELGIQVDEDGVVVIETSLVEPETPPPAQLAAELRALILAAPNTDVLAALYRELAQRPDKEAIKAETVANANGEPVTVVELFAQVGNALKAQAGETPPDDPGGAQRAAEPDPGPTTPPTAPEPASGAQDAAGDPWSKPATAADLGLADRPDTPLDRVRAQAEAERPKLEALQGEEAEAWARWGRRTPYVGKGAFGAIASAQLDDERLAELAADEDEAVVAGLKSSIAAWFVQADLDEHVEADPVPAARLSAARPRAAMTRANLGIQGKDAQR